MIVAGADGEITATGELMQQYDLDDMVEADVAELADGLEGAPQFSNAGRLVETPKR